MAPIVLKLSEVEPHIVTYCPSIAIQLNHNAL